MITEQSDQERRKIGGSISPELVMAIIGSIFRR